MLGMQASDGRALSFTYASGSHRVQTVSDGSRTWTYTYASASPYGLTQVTLPDNSSWQLQGLDNLLHDPSYSTPPSCSDDIGVYSTGGWTGSAVHPSGATATFTLTPTLHGRIGLSSAPVKDSTCGHPGFVQSYDAQNRYFVTESLTAKSIAGPGLSTLTWNYAYGPANTGAGCTSGCAENAVVTVADPRGYSTRTTFGNRFRANEGQLLQVDDGWTGSSAVRTTTYRYHAANAGPYPATIGGPLMEMGDNGLTSSFTPLDQRSVSQQAATFTWAANSFDGLARPLSVTKSSSLGYSRTETTAYADNAAKWVLGQIGSVSESTTGAAMVAYGYDSGTGALTSRTRFGHLEESLAYNADGTVATRTDGAGHTTRYSSYARGTPQGITYADNSTQSAVVANIGVLTSVTDEAGYTTSYGYDAMGRLASITPPAGDSVAWNPTSIAFEKVGSAEYDIAAGHWRQTVSTGNARTVTYYDALLRPLLVKSWDSASTAATGSDTLRRYDADGRTVYAAYPTRGLTSISASTPPGVSISYDALGRPVQTVASSELGDLTTASAYLSGLQTQTTNARNYTTTTAYQAWDDPASALIRSVAAPEGVSVAISRDVFGKPLSVGRSGSYAGAGVSATRSYVYDANQRLCKTVEPEVGATVQDYDGANNVAWKAPGQSQPATNDCSRSGVAAAAQITYGYDARNRLLSTTFGDNSAGITRSYTADGLPATIAANNATWSYAYNRRRLLASETLAYGGQSYAVGHGWDANGNAASLSYPDGASITYAPNALGHPTQAARVRHFRAQTA